MNNDKASLTVSVILALCIGWSAALGIVNAFLRGLSLITTGNLLVMTFVMLLNLKSVWRRL